MLAEVDVFFDEVRAVALVGDEFVELQNGGFSLDFCGFHR